MSSSMTQHSGDQTQDLSIQNLAQYPYVFELGFCIDCSVHNGINKAKADRKMNFWLVDSFSVSQPQLTAKFMS